MIPQCCEQNILLSEKSCADPYRFGYQGSEKDNEVSGEGNSYTTEFRQLDPRLGRWFSVDPVFQPWQSPYTSMDNNPIGLNDVLGDKTGDKDTKKINGVDHDRTELSGDPGVGEMDDKIDLGGGKTGLGKWVDKNDHSKGFYAKDDAGHFYILTPAEQKQEASTVTIAIPTFEAKLSGYESAMKSVGLESKISEDDKKAMKDGYNGSIENYLGIKNEKLQSEEYLKRTAKARAAGAAWAKSEIQKAEAQLKEIALQNSYNARGPGLESPIDLTDILSLGMPVGRIANAGKGWIVKDLYKTLSPELKLAAETAMKKGFVRAQGEAGIKMLAGKGIDGFRYEIKLTGKQFGGTRILGNLGTFTNGAGQTEVVILFEKLYFK